jgi:hypothetical protein
LSFRFLYRKLRAQQRTCSFCNEPILRNIIRAKNGELYHYGCYQTAKDEQYQCLECYSRFDRTEAALQTKQLVKGENEMFEASEPVCPNCGSLNLKRVHSMEEA